MKQFALFLIALVVVLTGCTTVTVPTITPTPSPTTTPEPTARVVVMEKLNEVKRGITPMKTTTAATCTVTGGQWLRVRAGPAMNTEIVGSLRPKTHVTVLEWGDEWHKITGGYISAKYCEGD